MSRFITLALISLTFTACASTSTSSARDDAHPMCRTNEVLYCANNGSHHSQRICSCLTQSAARAVVDSL
jgi:hypothetical protein